MSDKIRDLLQERFGRFPYQMFKAFVGFNWPNTADMLTEAGWRVWVDRIGMDEEIIAQARSDCGQDPKDTILVLITRDGDYSEMIRDLHEQGVDVYLGQPSWSLASKLRETVEEDHVIDLR